MSEHVIEQIAKQWDGCSFDAPGETIDIGDAIRRAGKRLLEEASPRDPTQATAWCWKNTRNWADAKLSGIPHSDYWHEVEFAYAAPPVDEDLLECLIHAHDRLVAYQALRPQDTELSCMILPMVRRVIQARHQESKVQIDKKPERSIWPPEEE